MPDFWMPLNTEPLLAGATSRLKNPRLAWLDLIGRARPGTNPKTLEAQLQVELHQWLQSHRPDMNSPEAMLMENQIVLATLLAAIIPARRASRVDPIPASRDSQPDCPSPFTTTTTTRRYSALFQTASTTTQFCFPYRPLAISAPLPDGFSTARELKTST